MCCATTLLHNTNTVTQHSTLLAPALRTTGTQQCAYLGVCDVCFVRLVGSVSELNVALKQRKQNMKENDKRCGTKRPRGVLTLGLGADSV